MFCNRIDIDESWSILCPLQVNESAGVEVLFRSRSLSPLKPWRRPCEGANLIIESKQTVLNNHLSPYSPRLRYILSYLNTFGSFPGQDSQDIHDLNDAR